MKDLKENYEVAKMRKLTNDEIQELSNTKNVIKIAVENFLTSMGTDVVEAMGNLSIDARQYRWNKETINAILEGMGLASGLE